MVGELVMCGNKEMHCLYLCKLTALLTLYLCVGIKYPMGMNHLKDFYISNEMSVVHCSVLSDKEPLRDG